MASQQRKYQAGRKGLILIKLIASDVDGTLLTEGSLALNPQMFDMIRALKKKGIQFVAASGRQYESMTAVFGPVKDDIIFVADNGSYIYKNDKLLEFKAFDNETWRKIVRFLMTIPNINLMISSREGTFTNSRDEEFYRTVVEGYKVPMKVVDNLDEQDLHVCKVGVNCPDGNPSVIADLGRKEGFDEVSHILISGIYWIDFMPISTDKGSAIMWIADHLGIRHDETMAFGDSNNDIGMLKSVAESYAVAGARPEAKKAAGHVLSEGVEQDAVLHMLQKMYKDVI